MINKKLTKGCFGCGLKDMCKINDDLDKIHIKYNVLGIEIATLVNEVQPAGSYEVEFDAANFSSGIYFYTINTNQFSETKKMILLR